VTAGAGIAGTGFKNPKMVRVDWGWACWFFMIWELVQTGSYPAITGFWLFTNFP